MRKLQQSCLFEEAVAGTSEEDRILEFGYFLVRVVTTDLVSDHTPRKSSLG
jgi:hypothetical protein